MKGGIAEVAAGAQHFVALTRGGKLVALGQGDRGQLTVPPGLRSARAVTQQT